MKKLELLPPQNLLDSLKSRLFSLKTALVSLKKQAQTAPAGTLRVAHNKNSVQFYLHQSAGTKDTYISKKDSGLISRLAQKSYNSKIVPLLQSEIKLLEDFISEQEKNEAAQTQLYASSPDRQPFLTPVTLSDRQYGDLWQKENYKSKEIRPDERCYKTARGELVRSKSEVIIADTLFRRGIPYKYEYPVSLKLYADGTLFGKTGIGNTKNFFPDFCCLNTRTRQEFFWEHFGMMDDSSYSETAAAKLNNYAMNGIFPGKNLLATYESKNLPLSVPVIEKLIDEYLI